ncbi:MAG: hypothetical protein HOP18_16665 [Deltaproteobacteria bacterium]|nr:hypothetical protein [Deltaproteobacteria bacterium]
MKRLVITAAAVFFLAAMTSPSLAHKTKKKHSHKKPVATQPADNGEAGTTTGKAVAPQPSVESQPQKVATPTGAPTEAKPAPAPAPTTTGAPTEAKPAVAPAPGQPSATDTMTDKATGMAKDKATEVVKEKATGAVMDAAKPSDVSAPTMPGSNPVSTVKPSVPTAPGMPK